MRIVVTGATGNVGTALVRRLLADPAVSAVTGVVRRPPDGELPGLDWLAVDLAREDAGAALIDAFRGADAVVHLAWAISPSHDRTYMRAVNVDGSRRVFAAAVAAGVPALIHASSVGAYSTGPKDSRVAESWPTDGIPSSTYSQHKAETERALDALELAQPSIRVVRMRPGLIFQPQAATAIARYFLGPLVPRQLLRRQLLPVVPALDRIALQVLHSEDAAAAYHRAITDDVRGAFNIAAEPVLDPPTLGQVLRARPVPLPAAPVRALVDLSWRLHLQPTEAGWFDMGRGVPLMDTTRARTELGWSPAYSSGEALLGLLDGFARRAAGPTPVLRDGPSLGQLVTDRFSKIRQKAGQPPKRDG